MLPGHREGCRGWEWLRMHWPTYVLNTVPGTHWATYDGSHPIQSPYSPSYDIISSCVTDFITTSKSLKAEIRACGLSTTNLCYFQTWLSKTVIHSTKGYWRYRDAVEWEWSLESDDPGLDYDLSIITPFFVESSAQSFSTAGDKWVLLFWLQVSVLQKLYQILRKLEWVSQCPVHKGLTLHARDVILWLRA